MPARCLHFAGPADGGSYSLWIEWSRLAKETLLHRRQERSPPDYHRLRSHYHDDHHSLHSLRYRDCVRSRPFYATLEVFSSLGRRISAIYTIPAHSSQPQTLHPHIFRNFPAR